MPIYTYKCPVCGAVQTAHRTIEYREDGPECANHFIPRPKTVRQLDAPMGVVNGPAVQRGNG